VVKAISVVISPDYFNAENYTLIDEDDNVLKLWMLSFFVVMNLLIQGIICRLIINLLTHSQIKN
jgi:hypothetical protein